MDRSKSELSTHDPIELENSSQKSLPLRDLGVPENNEARGPGLGEAPLTDPKRPKAQGFDHSSDPQSDSQETLPSISGVETLKSGYENRNAPRADLPASPSFSDQKNFEIPTLIENRSGLTTDALVVETWLRSKRSENTRKVYLAEWLKLHAVLPHGMGLRQLSIPALQKYFRDQKGEGRSPQSQRRSLWAIRSLLTFAHQFGYLAFNPGLALTSIEVPPTLFKRIIDEAAVFGMLAESVKRRDGARDELILRILYGAGVRVSELCDLNWGDLSSRAEGGVIQVCGKGQKYRTVFLSQTTWEKLEKFKFSATQVGDNDPIFRSTQEPYAMLTRHRVWQIVKACAFAAGLTGKISPHWLRHAHATHALSKGCPLDQIQETLGHADARTTRKYAHTLGERSSARYLGV